MTDSTQTRVTSLKQVTYSAQTIDRHCSHKGHVDKTSDIQRSSKWQCSNKRHISKTSDIQRSNKWHYSNKRHIYKTSDIQRSNKWQCSNKRHISKTSDIQRSNKWQYSKKGHIAKTSDIERVCQLITIPIVKHFTASLINTWNTDMDHWQNNTDKGKQKFLEKNLSQCQFFTTKPTPNCMPQRRKVGDKAPEPRHAMSINIAH